MSSDSESHKQVTHPGALVISLDFELIWGVLDRPDRGRGYQDAILGARAAIPRILELFREYDVHATWASVGFLFARDRVDLQRFEPSRLPLYEDTRLSPFSETVGEREADDPIHYGRSLIDLIGASPDQELATHTYSHYYCYEPGQDRESFRADLAAASLAAAETGTPMRSIVFPRNQHNPAYDDILAEAGLIAYRGNTPGVAWNFTNRDSAYHPARRLLRLVETYWPRGDMGTFSWDEVVQPDGLANVRASARLHAWNASRRWLEPLRLSAHSRALRYAARHRRIYHLWWHPHNFGRYTDENCAFLRRLLDEFSHCRERFGMRSLTMAAVAEQAKRSAA